MKGFTLKDRLSYYIIYAWMYLHALLPMKVLYRLSDILYLCVYYLVRYRLKVVRHNLANAFPEKSKSERRAIEKEFYRHFCDYFVETIKLLHITDAQMSKRMKFENIDLLNQMMAKGDSGFLLLGHYGNWEWVTSLMLHIDYPVRLGQIYRPLRNKAINAIFLKIRSRFHSIGIPKDDTYRKVVSWKRQGVQYLIGAMADQTPSVRNIHYWTRFLNQDTAVFTGIERMAKKTEAYVIYLDIQKRTRGEYVGRFEQIAVSSEKDGEHLITERYIRKFEHTILRNPAYWLWTHKRWKYQKEKL